MLTKNHSPSGLSFQSQTTPKPITTMENLVTPDNFMQTLADMFRPVNWNKPTQPTQADFEPAKLIVQIKGHQEPSMLHLEGDIDTIDDLMGMVSSCSLLADSNKTYKITIEVVS